MASHWLAELLAAAIETLHEDVASLDAIPRLRHAHYSTLSNISRLPRTSRWRAAVDASGRCGDMAACGQLLDLPELRKMLAEASAADLEGSCLWIKVVLIIATQEYGFPLLVVQRRAAEAQRRCRCCAGWALNPTQMQCCLTRCCRARRSRTAAACTQPGSSRPGQTCIRSCSRHARCDAVYEPPAAVTRC